MSYELLTDTCNRQEAGPYMGIDDVPDYNEGLMMVEYLDSFGNIPPINPGVSTTVPQNNDIALQDQREVVLTLLVKCFSCIESGFWCLTVNVAGSSWK